MAEPFSIAASEEVKRLLSIAKRHLGYINRSRSKRSIILFPDSPKLAHATVASIFSAAAIEAGLNLFISIPILYIKDENLRKFFGLLATKYSRLSVPQKVNFVCEFSPHIKQDKALLRRVHTLFAHRNSILHASPEYIEPLGLPDLEELPIPHASLEYIDPLGLPDLEELPSEIGQQDLMRYPQLSLRRLSLDEVGNAFQHYQTALDFLRKLTAYGPVTEEST